MASETPLNFLWFRLTSEYVGISRKCFRRRLFQSPFMAPVLFDEHFNESGQ